MTPDADGVTPLIKAIKGQHLEVADHLLGMKGIQESVNDQEHLTKTTGTTPYFYAFDGEFVCEYSQRLTNFKLKKPLLMIDLLNTSSRFGFLFLMNYFLKLRKQFQKIIHQK